MAYVPGFSYDLFISYASADLDDQLRSYIQGVRRYLKQELGNEFGEYSVFFDREAPNLSPVEWKDKLRASAASAALLIPILSPGYATSDYCSKEWEWFSEEHPLRWNAGTEIVFRICPVLWRIIHSDLLQQIAPEILAAQQQRPAGPEVLGSKIAAGLRLMRRPRPSVLVSETDHDIRQKVRNGLSRMGFCAVPESRMVFGNEQMMKELLGNAQAAIHFVGNQREQRAIDAIRWSSEFCPGPTLVYEIPGVELSKEEQLQLQWFEDEVRQAQEREPPRIYDPNQRHALSA